MKKAAWLAAGLLICCSPAFAQSETTVVRGINEVLRLIITIVGTPVLGYGLVRGFVAHAAGDEDGMRTARNAILGGLGIMFTFTLVKLIVQAAGVVGY